MDYGNTDYYDDDDYYDDNDDYYDDHVDFDDDCDRDHRGEVALRRRNGSFCKVITKECLSAAQREDLQRVMDLLSLREHHARTLLIHYTWDVDKVFQVFVEKGKDRLYEEASVMVHDDNLNSTHGSSLPLCEICMEKVPVYEMTTMDCGHCYCNNSHTDSLKAEITLMEKLQEKISNMEASELEIKDYAWVTNGADRLSRSRRTLSYSYPFAYYMFGDAFLSEEMTKKERSIKQNLFEDQQQQLEGHIEKLSHFLAEPFDEYPEKKVMESRMKIITLSKITDVLCKNLYDFVDKEILLHLRTTVNIAPYRSKGADKAVKLLDP